MMNSRSQLQLEPTFPLDEKEIKKRVRRETVDRLFRLGLGGVSASMWLGGVVFFWFGGEAGITSCALGLAATAYGLLHYAVRRDYNSVEARIISAMVSEHNRAQDQQLEEVATRLREGGFHGYSSALGKFILLKRHIDSNLHKADTPSHSNQEIDNLIDRICSLTCKHLSRLGKLDQEIVEALTDKIDERLKNLNHERAQILIHVKRAYVTMYECLDSLLNHKASSAVLNKPPQMNPDAENLAAMDKAIHKLENENDLIQRIDQRVRTELTLPTEPSEIMQTPGHYGKKRSNRDNSQKTAE